MIRPAVRRERFRQLMELLAYYQWSVERALCRAGLMDGPEGGYYSEMRLAPWRVWLMPRRQRLARQLARYEEDARQRRQAWIGVSARIDAEREKIEQAYREHIRYMTPIPPFNWFFPTRNDDR